MQLNSFLQFFTRAWRKAKTIKRKPSKNNSARLLVEMLERRDLLAAPTIVATSILPVDGSTTPTGSPAIIVQFSESMNPSALLPTSYVLLGSSGTPVTINSAVFLDP